MVKVRFDIAIAMICILIIVSGVNTLLPYEKGLYKEYLETASESEYVSEVSNLKELEAVEAGMDVILKVEKKNIKKTKFVARHNSRNSMYKYNALQVALEFLLSGYTYDSLYVAELEDGTQLLVKLYPRALSLSDGTVKLPIGELEDYPDSNISKALDNKYELVKSEQAGKYLCLNASRYDYSLEEQFEEAGEKAKKISWAAIVILIILYTIFSTIIITKARKRSVGL